MELLKCKESYAKINILPVSQLSALAEMQGNTQNAVDKLNKHTADAAAYAALSDFPLFDSEVDADLAVKAKRARAKREHEADLKRARTEAKCRPQAALDFTSSCSSILSPVLGTIVGVWVCGVGGGGV